MTIRTRALVLLPTCVVRTYALRSLLGVVARAAGVDAPMLRGPYRHRLETCARFSHHAARGALEHGTSQALETALRAETRAMGARMAALLGVSTRRDGFLSAAWFYRLIGIDFHADTNGSITIRRCFFSTMYTPEICGVISALDEGFLIGLVGEGRLVFHTRLTEGHPACLARFGASA